MEIYASRQDLRSSYPYQMLNHALTLVQGLYYERGVEVLRWKLSTEVLYRQMGANKGMLSLVIEG